MEKITFKVVYMHPGTTPRTLELLREDYRGSVTFIDNNGARFDRRPVNGESPAKLVLRSTETYVLNGEPMKRAYGSFSYLPISSSSKAGSEAEMSENTMLREAHELLKTHQAVVVRDSTGNDVNPNRHGFTCSYELIDETQKVKDEVEKNTNALKASNLCTEMFNDNKEAFLDFCYAYGITNITSRPVDVIYNEAMLKISINPNHFLQVIEDKDRELKTLINKGLTVHIEDPMNVGLKTAISLEGDLYYIDGEIIANNYEKLVAELKTNLRLKEVVQRKLGITPSGIPEVKNLPPSSDDLVYTKHEEIYSRKYDAVRLAEMEKAVKYSYKKYEKDAVKNKSAAEVALKSDLERKGEGFSDIKEAYDAYVENQKQYYIK